MKCIGGIRNLLLAKVKLASDANWRFLFVCLCAFITISLSVGGVRAPAVNVGKCSSGEKESLHDSGTPHHCGLTHNSSMPFIICGKLLLEIHLRPMCAQ